MSLKIGQQTAVSRLTEARQAVTQCGLDYDRAKKQLAEFNEAARTLVQDQSIEKRRRELEQTRDHLFHLLQEQVQLLSFYKSAMPAQHNPDDWRRR